MRSTLARGLLVLTLLGALTAWAPTTSYASAELCWQLLPFSDVIHVSIDVTATPTPFPVFDVHVRLRALAFPAAGSPGEPYQALGAGALTPNIAPFGSGDFDMGFSFTPNTTSEGQITAAFDGNDVCHFYATGIKAPLFDGVWRITCTGAGFPTPPFARTGNLLFLGGGC